MEAWVSPNASKNRPQKSNKKLIKGTPSQEPFQGRVLGGFWMDLGSILGGFWTDLGGLGSPNGHEKRYISRKLISFPKDPSREALGRVLGGFGEVWGRFWEGFGRILRGFFNKLANPSES